MPVIWFECTNTDCPNKKHKVEICPNLGKKHTPKTPPQKADPSITVTVSSPVTVNTPVTVSPVTTTTNTTVDKKKWKTGRFGEIIDPEFKQILKDNGF